MTATATFVVVDHIDGYTIRLCTTEDRAEADRVAKEAGAYVMQSAAAGYKSRTNDTEAA